QIHALLLSCCAVRTGPACQGPTAGGPRSPPRCVPSGSGGVETTVDVDDLAGGGGKPVRQQSHHGLGRGFGVVDVPPQGGAFGPVLSQFVEAGDAARGHGAQRSGRDQVDPDVAVTDVTGQVAGGGGQCGLGHTHPVVDGVGDAVVEVHRHDRATVLHQGQQGGGQGL